MSDRQVLLFAAAAWLGALVQRGPSPWLAGALLALALAARWPVVAMVAVALLAGGLATHAVAGLAPPEPGAWHGWVTLVTDPGAIGDDLSVLGRIEPGADRGVGHHVELRAPADGPLAAALGDRLSGERVEVSGQLRPLPPGAGYLSDQHVVARLTVEDVSRWRPGSVVTRASNWVRRLLARGATGLPAEQRPLFNGLLLGDDRGQSAVVADDFDGAGLTHLLVVSGENVAFVLALFGPFLRRLRLRTRLVMTLGVVMWFAVLTRLEPSVLRASVMAAIAAGAAATGRQASGLRVLGLAVAALVVVDPFLVHRLGFQLSVAASAGILAWARPLGARLPGPRWLAETMAVTLAAQAAVAPLLVAGFGGVPVVSVLANVLAAPAVGPVTVYGLAAGAVAGVVGRPVAAWVHLPTRLMLAWVSGVARSCAALPLGSLGVRPLAGLAAAVLAWWALGRWLPERAPRTWLRGPVVVLAAVAVLSPALGLLRPPPWAATPARGVTVWRSAGATVVAVDYQASARDALAGLRLAGVRHIDVLVVRTAASGAPATVAALVKRYRPRLVRSPSAGRLAGAMPVQSEVTGRVGGLEVDLADRVDRLAVAVVPAGRSP